MTPAAQLLARLLLRPRDQREFPVDPETVNLVSGFLRHAVMFDATATQELHPLVKQMAPETIADLLFLPAPVTWLEFDFPSEGGGRGGAVFICTNQVTGREEAISVYCLSPTQLSALFVLEPKTHDVYMWDSGPPNMKTTKTVLREAGFTDESIDGYHNSAARLVVSALVAINSPKIVEFEPQQSPKLLERKLMDARIFDRNRPSSGWTRVTLGGAAVGRPTETDSRDERTGPRKRLHYCRAHIRITRGKLQRVTGHWRGNAELGRTRAVYSFKNKGA